MLFFQHNYENLSIHFNSQWDEFPDLMLHTSIVGRYLSGRYSVLIAVVIVSPRCNQNWLIWNFLPSFASLCCSARK